MIGIIASLNPCDAALPRLDPVVWVLPTARPAECATPSLVCRLFVRPTLRLSLVPSVSARDDPRDCDSLSLVVVARDRPRDRELPEVCAVLYELVVAIPVE